MDSVLIFCLLGVAVSLNLPRVGSENPYFERSQVGKRVHLTCHWFWSLNQDAHFIAWKKNGRVLSIGYKLITPNKRYHIRYYPNDMAGMNLIIDPVQSADRGVYNCILYGVNRNVTETRTTYLTVNVQLKPVLTREDVEVSLGSNFTVSCTTQRYSSRIPSHNVLFQKYLRKQYPEVVKVGTSLLKSNVKRKDEGEYRCRMITTHTSPSNTLYAYFRVHIKRNLTVHSIPQRIVEEGRECKLPCLIDGFPEPFSVTWERVDGDLSNRSAIERMRLWDTDRRHQVQVNLHISSVTAEDGGLYRCVALDTTGNIALAENATELRISYMGEITNITSPQPVDEFTGSDVTLECRADGYPLPAVIWSKETDNDGTPVQAEHLSQEAGPGYSRITLRNVTSQHGGYYACVAGNGYGLVKRKRTLLSVKTYESPLPPNVGVRDIWMHSIYLVISMNPLSARAVDEIYIITCIEMSTGRQVARYNTSGLDKTGAEGAIVTEVTGLSPVTTYEVTVDAVNVYGTTRTRVGKIVTKREDCLAGRGYSGKQSRAGRSKNRECIRWDSPDIPDSAYNLDTYDKKLAMYYLPRNLSEAVNYCRIIFRPTPWCFVRTRFSSYPYREFCNIPKCDYHASAPIVQWIKCDIENKCHFQATLPMKDTGSSIKIHCNCAGVTSTDRFKYFHMSPSPNRVFHFSIKCGSFNANVSRSAICKFTTVNKLDKATSEPLTLEIPLVDQKVKASPDDVPSLSVINTGTLQSPPNRAVVIQGETTTLGCKGTNIGDHVMFLKRNGTILASTVLVQSAWKRGAPLFPSVVTEEDGKIRSLTVQIAFKQQDGGAVFTCHVDTFPPITVDLHILVYSEG